MKPWRSERKFVTRRPVLAALATALVFGWTQEPHAETGAPAVGTLSRAALDRLGDTIRNEVATGKIPGAIFLICQHGKQVYFESFGVRDPDTGQSMKPDALFQIYSMSKAVTSVAGTMLVDDGKL